MNDEPTMPIAIADYYSENNWNAFLAFWTDEQRAKAPTYAEAAKSLDDHMEALHARGVDAHRVKVKAAEWEAWVISNGHPKVRESVAFFAADQLSKERRGLLDRPNE